MEQRLRCTLCPVGCWSTSAQPTASTSSARVYAAADFDYELQMAQMNRQLDRRGHASSCLTAPEWAFVSSSLVREVATLGGDVTAFLPAKTRRARDGSDCISEFGSGRRMCETGAICATPVDQCTLGRGRAWLLRGRSVHDWAGNG